MGGAIGDALGYAVEFVFSYHDMQRMYGPQGITRYDLARNGKGLVSDDTQMTLFTANGLLVAAERNMPLIDGIRLAYLEWYQTQTNRMPGKPVCWIRDVKEMNVSRAPGNTCLSSIYDISRGLTPHNQSKGCGGVMRIAPIPLYGAVDQRMTEKEVISLAVEATKLTHLHPLGYISSALCAQVISVLAQAESPDRQLLKEALDHFFSSSAPELFPALGNELSQQKALVDMARRLADNARPDVDNVESIGGGWTGDETIAIAIYCALRHFDNFENCMIAAVNHAGDSDSTGAVAGNILGAACGYDHLPGFYTANLELHDTIVKMADDLTAGTISL